MTQFYGNGTDHFHVNEAIGENYFDSLEVYTNEKFLGMGLKIVERTEFVVSDYPATFMLADNPGPQNGFILSFGDSSRTIVISGTAEFKSDNDRIEFIAALLLTQYDPLLELRPYDHVRFIPDTINTDFRLLRYNASGFTYTENGRAIKQPSTFDPCVVISPIFNDKKDPLDLGCEGYIHGLRTAGFYALMVDSTHNNKYDDLETFTWYGKCFINDKFLYTIIHIQQQNYIPLISQGVCLATNTEGIQKVTEFCLSVKY